MQKGVSPPADSKDARKSVHVMVVSSKRDENLVGLLSLDREFWHSLIGAARLLAVIMDKKKEIC